MRAHSITEEQLSDVTKIEEKLFHEEIRDLIMEIQREAKERGYNIPIWLRREVEKYKSLSGGGQK